MTDAGIRARRRRAMERAATSQKAAIDMAASRGDVAEEARRRRSLALITRKGSRVDSDLEAARAQALRMLRDGMTRGRVDWLARLADGPDPALSAIHLRAAQILRDHAEAATSSHSEVRERVQGGKMHNGQMEGLCDRRRAIRWAWNAALDAVEDDAVLPGVVAMILTGASLNRACDLSRIGIGGAQARRIKTGVGEALGAAAAHIGIAE